MPRRLPADITRETIVRARDVTNPEYGYSSPEDIPIEHLLSNGIISLDKPAGPTSHEVATWVRKILKSDRAGHSGTLDPGVTGILPIAVGDATKALQALLPAGKEYVCILELHKQAKSDDDIRAIVKEFIGKIYQKPPLRSSVKRILRVREVYYNEILEIEGRLVLMRVGCEAGTYIRKLCFDIGEALGVGGHMRELRRTRVGHFSEDDHLCTLHDLTDAYHFWIEDNDESELRKYLLPVEHSMIHLPTIVIRDSAVDAICHGADLAASGVLSLETGIKKDDLVAVKTLKDEAVAIGKANHTSEAIAKANTGIVVTTERVIMERGRYPRLWKSKSE